MDQFIVATYQGPLIENSLQVALDKVEETLCKAQDQAVDLLCMPECFLQGYFEKEDEAWNSALDLQQEPFLGILERFKPYKTTLILGLNEKRQDRLYNSAVVIEEGRLVGKYSKAHLELDYYSQGMEFPLFERRGIKYGIIICLDSTYLEPARILALKGAQILFCPMCNRTNLAYYRENHPKLMRQKSHFIARAFENHVWLVTSDCIWPDDGTRVCAGYSAIYNPEGEEVVKADFFSETLLVTKIPFTVLEKRKSKRIYGDPAIAKKLVEVMQKEKTHVGAYAYIEEGNKLLLTKKKKGPYCGLWDFPGGKIEFGETPQEALRRECKEELGMEFESLKLLDTLSYTHEEWFHHMGMIYSVKGIRPLENLLPEEEFSWFPLSNLPELTPFVKILIK